MREKVGILSLGCPRNLSDSESIIGRLAAKGHPIVDMQEADIGIINTCAFIEDAKRESVDAILDLVSLKKQGRLKKIIVHGCLTQRYKEILKKELPEVDAFVGKVSLNHETKRYAITPGHYAYLKICEGCVNNCSFCVIPKIKGRFTSLTPESVISKVKAFSSQGIRELNLIGQDISGYGMDLRPPRKLETLLSDVVKNSGDIPWIRLLYLYPSRITDGLLKLIRDNPKVCKYIDLPIQHISPRILKLMNRGTKAGDIIALIAKIRKIVPEAALRTSVICGFPSETEKEFGELLKFIEEARFERLGAFVYSREESTPAYALKGQVPGKVKLERFNAVMSLQQKISSAINSGFLGRTIEVLIEEEEDGRYVGRSRFDAPEVDGAVYVNSKRRFKPGDIIEVKVTDTLEYDLVGEA